jgi:hypothetical protein
MEARDENDDTERATEGVYSTATTAQRVMALLALVALLASAAWGTCRILNDSGGPAPVIPRSEAVEGALQLPAAVTSEPPGRWVPRRISPAAS